MICQPHREGQACCFCSLRFCTFQGSGIVTTAELRTQVLVYMAVAKKGEKPTDGVTDLNPEGLTAAHGEHAAAVAQLLHSGGMSCKVLDKVPFTKAMLEKLVWIRRVSSLCTCVCISPLS